MTLLCDTCSEPCKQLPGVLVMKCPHYQSTSILKPVTVTPIPSHQ